MHTLVAALVVLLSASAFAAEPSSTTSVTSTTSTAAVNPSPSSNTVHGKYEFKPTWTTSTGGVEAQNNVELGWVFNSDRKVFGVLGFNYDVTKPNSQGQGFDVRTPDARIEADFMNVLSDRQAGTAFDFKPEMHLPTDGEKRLAGMALELRSPMVLSKRLNDSVRLEGQFVPMFHIYSKAGYVNAKGQALANPLFEHKFEFNTLFSFTNQLKLNWSMRFHQIRFANFQSGAKLNDQWGFVFNIKPELTYALDRNLTFGLAFETANLVTDKLNGWNVDEGVKNALAQFMLIASL